MDRETVETRIARLAQALSAATAPLARLSEYANDLEQLISDHQLTEAECVAALIRIEAPSVKEAVTRTLDEVQEAAVRVARV